MRRNIVNPITIVIMSLFLATTSMAIFPEDEAGICAYTDAGKSLNIALVKPLYRTIELETTDYIIGSMPVGDYAETEDVHVYVHKDGWVAAYYLATDPTSKIINWRDYQGADIPPSKLELALQKVANAANFLLVDVDYYHFMAPQADKLLIAADREEASTSDTFQITIPGDLVVYERSWGLYGYDASASQLYIDDELIKSIGSGNTWNIAYGSLLPSQLTQAVPHTVKVLNSESSYYGYYGYTDGGVVLVYR